MRNIQCLTLLIFLTSNSIWADPSGEPDSNRREHRFYTVAEARLRAFGEEHQWRDTVIVVDSLRRSDLYESSRLSEGDSIVSLSYALDDSGHVAAVYRIAKEVGKYAPFEFLVALGPDLRVKDVIVLTYRESRGGEVGRSRFLRQYRDKSFSSPVRLSRDIIGIAGATLSAQAVNRGVKKALWWAHNVWADRGDSE
jgi:Na+-translocating ferredoxin:NAD+ oxidoreductase RnfG subunit